MILVEFSEAWAHLNQSNRKWQYIYNKAGGIQQ
jgi:hypothetical protein